MNTDTATRDNLAIRETIEHYFDAVCRRRSDELMALWDEDCRWSVPDIPGLEDVRGKDAIRGNFVAAQGMYPVAFVVGMVGDIAIEGDTARARVWVTEMLKDTSGASRHGCGLYADTLVKRDGRWLFRERVWQPMHHINA